jgi:hypothetical protein
MEITFYLRLIGLDIECHPWWKNIMALEEVVPGKNWFLEAMERNVGNGNSTSFWNINWIGETSLAVTYPRLFSLCNSKDKVVKDFVDINGGWFFSWRRNLFNWEEDLVVSLKNTLAAVTLSLEDDCWRWCAEVDGNFSVKSTYNLLVRELIPEEEVEEVWVNVLHHIWDSPAPSKVIAFSWQLLYDRISTRNNLVARGVVAVDVPWECLGCVGKVESSSHLFLHCPSAMLVWREVFRWLGISFIIPPSIGSLFEMFRGAARNAKVRSGFLLIWHATLWTIWKARNSAIFASGFFSPRVIVEDIKVLSWKWSLYRLKTAPCMYYEWIWDPGDCLLR